MTQNSCAVGMRNAILRNHLKQLERRSLKKIRASTGFEPVTSTIPFIYNHSSNMNYFIYASNHFAAHGRYELNKLTSLPMCGFIAQLVEHRIGIAEVTGSNPFEALIFFRLLLSNCLNWKLTAMIILHFRSVVSCNFH